MELRLRFYLSFLFCFSWKILPNVALYLFWLRLAASALWFTGMGLTQGKYKQGTDYSCRSMVGFLLFFYFFQLITKNQFINVFRGKVSNWPHLPIRWYQNQHIKLNFKFIFGQLLKILHWKRPCRNIKIDKVMSSPFKASHSFLWQLQKT